MILIPKYQNVIEVGGSLSIIVTDGLTNQIKQEVYVPNLIVTLGKAFIASRMVGTAQATMSHMGIGTDSSVNADAAIEVAKTALGAELTVSPGGYTGYARAALTPTPSATNNVVTYATTFNAQNPSAPSGGAVLREAGIFNAATGGTMLCRTTFPIVTKLPADALAISWTITIS